MEKSTDLVPLDPRMNAFHLAVAVHQERTAWILDHLVEQLDHPAVFLLHDMNDQLNKLIKLHDAT